MASFFSGLAQGVQQGVELKSAKEDRDLRNKMIKLQTQQFETQLKMQEQKQNARQSIFQAMQGTPGASAQTVGLNEELAGGAPMPESQAMPAQQPRAVSEILADAALLPQLQQSGMLEPFLKIAENQREASASQVANDLLKGLMPGDAGGAGGSGGGMQVNRVTFRDGKPQPQLGFPQEGTKELSPDGSETLVFDKRGRLMGRRPAPANFQRFDSEDEFGNPITVMRNITPGAPGGGMPAGAGAGGGVRGIRKHSKLNVGDAGLVVNTATALKSVQDVRATLFEHVGPDGKLPTGLLMGIAAGVGEGRGIKRRMRQGVEGVIRARTGRVLNDQEVRETAAEFVFSVFDLANAAVTPGVDATEIINGKIAEMEAFAKGSLDAMTLPPRIRAKLDKAIASGELKIEEAEAAASEKSALASQVSALLADPETNEQTIKQKTLELWGQLDELTGSARDAMEEQLDRLLKAVGQ